MKESLHFLPVTLTDRLKVIERSRKIGRMDARPADGM